MAVRKTHVRLNANASAVKQISTALTCVTAAILETLVKTAVVQMMIVKKMLGMKVMIAVDRTGVFSLEQSLSSDLHNLVIVILRLLMLVVSMSSVTLDIRDCNCIVVLT